MTEVAWTGAVQLSKCGQVHHTVDSSTSRMRAGDSDRSRRVRTARCVRDRVSHVACVTVSGARDCWGITGGVSGCVLEFMQEEVSDELSLCDVEGLTLTQAV